MVMNGPTPIMSIMFSAVALASPSSRSSPAEANFGAEPRPAGSFAVPRVGARRVLLVGVIVHQVHKQPHSPRHAAGQLPKE